MVRCKMNLLLVPILCLVTIVSSKSSYGITAGAKHLLIAPSHFIAGVSNKVCISRFGTAVIGSAVAQIELLAVPSNATNDILQKNPRFANKYIAKTKKVFSEGNGGCVDWYVPKTIHRKAILLLRMRFDKLANYKVNSQKQVSIQHDANIVIVQTDKPVYRAGEEVKFRILQLKTDLTPSHLPIYRISIVAPPEMFGGPIKIAQWSNISTQMGVMQREYKLSKYAQLGEWRIVVDSKNPTIGSTEQIFYVTDYVLPTFYVSVVYQKNILPSFKQLVWTICAKYMYGETVRGTLYVNVKTDSYDSQTHYFKRQIDEPHGCYNHSVRTNLLGFGNEVNDIPKAVIAEISFQEDGTKIWKNTTEISNVKKEVVKLQLVNDYGSYFKPGLPYEMKVKVTNWDEIPVLDANVEFCKVYDTEIEKMDIINKPEILYDQKNSQENIQSNITKNIDDKCEIGITNKNGLASFLFTVPVNLNVKFINLKAKVLSHSLEEFDLKSDEKEYIQTMTTLYSWGNKSNIHMDIGSPMNDISNLTPGAKHIFPIYISYKTDISLRRITFHYLIVTRSGTLFYWGISSQCIHPIHDVQNIQTVYGPSFSDTDCIDDRYSESGVYKTMLNVKISHQMCPYSQLIVYFMNQNGEFIMASKRINVGECFINKVSQQWIPSTTSPSSRVKLNLKSKGPAVCLVRSMNTALKHITPMISVRENIVNKLKNFIDLRHKRIQKAEMDNMCFIEFSSELEDESLRTLFGNILREFHFAGIELITDILPETEKCSNEINDKPEELYYSSRSSLPKERTYFPETWLWEMHLMDSSDSLDIQGVAPDDITVWENEAFCINRLGIATSIPSQESLLRVYQPFFIDLTIPRMIKRGEDVKMSYKIFNYLDYEVPVVSELEVLPYAAVTITSVTDGTFNQFSVTQRMTCIPSKQSQIVHFTIKAQQLGPLKISVTAQLKAAMKKMCSPNSISAFTSYSIRDEIIKEVIVEPEGIPIENYRSAMLCTNEYTNKTEISWGFERDNCVNDSENWFVSLVGDIVGPMSIAVDKLVSMPMGCGEQNMALTAYNLIALEYSIAGKRASGEMKNDAINNLLFGYQRQLKFWHPDTGAFSAFGPADNHGSTWLTAFCIKYLSVLKHKWNIGNGNNVIEMASKWLLDRQMENGCFSNEGQVFHRELKGGLYSETSNIALAAYAVISIIDAKIDVIKLPIIKNIIFCLGALKYNTPLQYENEIIYDKNPEKTYTFALATLAQLKIEKHYKGLNAKTETSEKKSSFKRQTDDVLEDIYTIPNGHNMPKKQYGYLARGGLNAVSLLRSMAQRQGDLVWWEAGSLSVSIETTAYAILSLLEVGGNDNILDSIAAARWLSMHRNAEGGFISTQDTLIAIEALCSLRYVMQDNPPSLNIDIESPKLMSRLTVNPIERYRLRTVAFKSIDSQSSSPTTLKIKATGTGCIFVQATQRYNKLSSIAESSPFGLFVMVKTDGTFDCKENNTWCMCAAVLEVCVTWNDPTGAGFPEMAILEVQLPTGYSPDRHYLYQLIKSENILLRRIEESTDKDTIHLYLSQSSKILSNRPSECYNIYTVGAKSHTLPALVKVYDYYHTEISQSTTYMIPQLCPYERSRRPHEEPDNLSKNDDDTIKTDGSAESSPHNPEWHIIDTEYDLEVPKTMEGVQPVYVLPPKDFDVKKYENYHPTEDISDASNHQSDSPRPHPFENWTVIDSERDLDFPDGLEGTSEIWAFG